jgi:RNase P/RNase MRP subunit p29
MLRRALLASVPLLVVADACFAHATPSAAAPPASAVRTARPTPAASNASDASVAQVADELLPVRELTVFKDGHAFVLREGPLKPGAEGRVVLDKLPQPLLGTFWPYATEGARVSSAVAARERVVIERAALDLRQLVEANRGAQVVVTDVSNQRIEGALVGIPRRSADELDRAATGASGPRLDEPGNVVAIATASGTRVLPLELVRDLEVRGALGTRYAQDELRERLTLRVDGGTAASRVGVAYVQKGLRWIPSYKVDVADPTKAKFELEATLVNDLADFRDATVHLVVGVPRFEMQGMLDPIALQEAAARVAGQIEQHDRFSNMLSNALMTQSASYRAEPAAADAPQPGFESASSNEDLYVYTLRHVTLARGERLVLPITSFELGYRDVYTLDVAVAPPAEFQSQFDGSRIEQLAKLAAASKVQHALRLSNRSGAPLTTAPALVFAGGRVIGQSLLHYTPVGAETDLVMATALDVCVEKTERETRREPAPTRWRGDDYQRIDMRGELTISNKKKEPVELEVRRTVLGLADSVEAAGTSVQVSPADWWADERRPVWWSWWNWPYWWYHWNGVARFEWKVRLEPGESKSLGASWHYYWN